MILYFASNVLSITRFSFPKMFSIFILIVFCFLFSSSANACKPKPAGNIYETRKAAYEAAWCDINERFQYYSTHPVLSYRWRDYSLNYSKVCSNGIWRKVANVYYNSTHRGIQWRLVRPENLCSPSNFGTDTSQIYYYNKTCQPPFYNEVNECITYCPIELPNLDLSTGQCFSTKNVKKTKDDCGGNPIILNTGEKYQTEIDLQLDSPNPIIISRTYRSFRTPQARRSMMNKTALQFSGRVVKHKQSSGYSSSFGGNTSLSTPIYNGVESVGHNSWSFSTNTLLQLNGAIVKVVHNDDTVYFDRNASGEYQARQLENATLEEGDVGENAKWKYYSESGNFYFFNNSGSLIKTINKAGFSHQYTQLSESNLGKRYKIEDQFSNSVIITKYRREGYILRIEASNGVTINYQYHNNSNNLIKVTKTVVGDPEDEEALTQLIKTYHYESAEFPYALTGITDENGVRFASWTYDDVGRAIQSTHANGVENTQVHYEKNSTTVTNELGKKTKYNYSTIAGAKRLVNLEGVATESCAAANQAYTYYATGRIKTQTDWQGNVTYFEYNSKGQITKRTSGYGSPEAYSVQTLWHATLNKPLEITYPKKKEKYKYNDQGKLINKNIVAL